MSNAIEVRHNAEAHRFETTVDGMLCHTDYALRQGTMAMLHTEVPEALGGRGIGSALVQTAFAHAREHGLRVAPYCSYVRSFVSRHPEVQDLVID